MPVLLCFKINRRDASGSAEKSISFRAIFPFAADMISVVIQSVADRSYGEIFLLSIVPP